LVYQFKNELCEYSEQIIVSPSKYCLKSFGGYMSINDFRSLDNSKTFMISTEGLSYINQDIIEIKNSS
jgi:hypothetical protein